MENEGMMDLILEVKHIKKNFGPTVALDNVSLSVKRGQILGLIGENGSGKSTVTSIIAGMQKADDGEIFFKKEKWKPESMLDALEHGIGMIVQETGTISGITVAENIFLGESKLFKRWGFINRSRMYQEAKKALDFIGAYHISPEIMTGLLDLQDRKLIEIARIMSKEPEILIIDETTTALSQIGRKIIYKIMDWMKEKNKTIIFISHDLDEIMSVCDRLTVLRDGNIITTFEKEEFDEQYIKASMIGRELQGDYYRSDYDGSYSEQVVLEIKEGQKEKQLRNFSLQLHKGEILGIGGLSHCGMHELGKVLFGAEKLQSGEVLVHGKLLKNEADAMKYKLGYVAKDRDIESLCLTASIKDNISVVGMEQFAVNKFLILPSKENAYVKRQIHKLQIKCRDSDQPVSALSGGNKQKVVFGKWIGRESEILILDCPTRGVDIGVKQAMYQLMYSMKKEGKSIIIISEEMSELIGMSDRLLVMKDGTIMKEFLRGKELSEAEIIQHMI